MNVTELFAAIIVGTANETTTSSPSEGFSLSDTQTPKKLSVEAFQMKTSVFASLDKDEPINFRHENVCLRSAGLKRPDVSETAMVKVARAPSTKAYDRLGLKTNIRIYGEDVDAVEAKDVAPFGLVRGEFESGNLGPTSKDPSGGNAKMETVHRIAFQGP